MKYIIIWFVTISYYSSPTPSVDAYTNRPHTADFTPMIAILHTEVDTFIKVFDDRVEALSFLEQGIEHPKVDSILFDSIPALHYKLITK